MQICPACLERYEDDVERCPGDREPLLATGVAGDERCGAVIADRFLLLERLAQGAMGAVYRAWQHSMQREVALKLVPAQLAAREPVRRRLLREARATGTLRSPHVVGSYDSGFTADGEFFIAMELAPGRTLAQLLREEGPLPLPRALPLLRQLCLALEAVHAAGFVHRDLKPGNILVERRGGRDFVRLVDFGLVRVLGDEQSRITLSGETIGSPAYLSPEQAAGQPAGPAADLYALGVIAFELVSGRLPFTAHNIFQLMGMHIYATPPPLIDATGNAPAYWALGAVVKRCLQKDPVHRPASAADLRLAIAAIDPRGCERPMVTPVGGLPEWERLAQEAPTFQSQHPGAARAAAADAPQEPLRLPLSVRFPRLHAGLGALRDLRAALAPTLAALVALLSALPAGVRAAWTRFRSWANIRASRKPTAEGAPEHAALAPRESRGAAERPLPPPPRPATALVRPRGATEPAVRAGGAARPQRLFAPVAAAGPACRSPRLALPLADAPTFDERQDARWDAAGGRGAALGDLRRATDARTAGGR